MGANWFKFEFPNSAPFFVKGFDLHIIRTDSSSLAKGGGILTYKDSKEGWRQLEAIIITYIKRIVVSLCVCVCIHYNQTFHIDFCVCVSPLYERYFLTWRRIRFSVIPSLGPLLLFHLDTLPRCALLPGGEESIEIDSRKFLFSFPIFNKSLRHAAENWYINLLQWTFLWLYTGISFFNYTRRIRRRFK